MGLLKKIIRKTESQFDKIQYEVKEKFGLFDEVIIYPFRGYGNQNRAVIQGRILEKEPIIHEDKELPDTFWTNLKKTWKRYESDEIPGVSIKGELYGYEARCTSDNEGYFTLEFNDIESVSLVNGWHNVNLEITDMPFDLDYNKTALGEILICEQQNPFGIISDVDDTIIVSDAMHSIKRIITMISNDAPSRVPFEGVSEFYHGLIHHNRNPLFFVSGSSYNLYDMLVNFCEHHDIPKAPFILRDLGIDKTQWIRQDSEPYKISNIEKIFEMYPKLKFILIGDSGQHDPEIYLKVYQEYPDRVLAIYIRHVYTDERKVEVEKMSDQTKVPFLIMETSKDAYSHAKENGWIN
ncbi:App1 family protein [Mangrovivirga cuniculi]|uniref:Phosphatidate phosphatase APP1 catalytic domain-containing protein n=1 Tax=Mangrovivirga cuniculi TaxID=2715131 RepID=A0A4D7JQW9_9BACT|nr:phosphatase domain-containing protein [Mangrovivirga cuniculi]QCK15162.1 hypothetical protein DCC35_10595 [Mangrovivirga cuniculi]